jgi:stage V sporulation protein G
MEITEVKIFPVNEDKLKAYVTIIFENCFVVRDLKIINGNTGLFVAMPSKKRKDGTFRDIAHPLNSDMRNAMEKLILKSYEEELKKMTAAAVTGPAKQPLPASSNPASIPESEK